MVFNGELEKHINDDVKVISNGDVIMGMDISISPSH